MSRLLKIQWLPLFLAAVLTCSFAGCGGDDGDDRRVPSTDTSGDGSGNSSVKPTDDVPDPEGTITLSMRNAANGKTLLDDLIYIDKADNFNSSGAIQYLSYGSVKGLGNVSRIPVAGWASKMSCTPGNGYIAYNTQSNTYYRLYVDQYIESVSGGVLGAEVKYQRPFKGVDEALKPEKTAVDCSDGAQQTVKMLNATIIPYTVTSTATWAYAAPYLNELRIWVDTTPTSAQPEEATVTLTTLYGKKTDIKVTRTLQTSLHISGESSFDVGAGGAWKQVPVTLNFDASELKVVPDVDWLVAEVTTSSRNTYVEFTALANSTQQSRTGHIALQDKTGKELAQIEVRQQAPAVVTMNATDTYHNFSSYYTTAKSAADLKFTSSVKWMTVNYVDVDNYGAVSFQAITTTNYASAARSGQIDVTNQAGKKLFTVQLKQSAGDPSMAFSQQTVYFDKNSGNATITCNLNAENEKAVSSASWCTFTQNGSQLTIRVSATTTNRKATIKFPDSGIELAIDQSKYAVSDNYREGSVTGTVV